MERTAKTDQTVQADLSLRWADKSFCWFCHAAAHLEVPLGIKNYGLAECFIVI